jgi:DNA-binding transcriptional ArsR family regulator
MLATFAALAEPNRLRIIDLLRERPCAVGELSARLELRQPQVSKHLKILSDAGLVEGRVDGQRRIYRLRAQPWAEMEAWLEAHRRAWSANPRRLDELLDDLKTAPRKAPAKKPKKAR